MSRSAPLTLSADDGPTVGDVLVRRFIDRSQRFRRTGAIVGIVLMLAYLIALGSNGEDGVNLNVLVMASIGLAGSIGGSILAEGFRVRRRGPRIASLDVRDPDTYRDRTADQRERVLLVLAAAGVAGALITGEHLERVIGLGGVVVALALLRRWVMHRIALRPRPVVPVEVEAADDEVRRLASSAGISRPMVTLGALAVSSLWWAGVAPGVDRASSTEVVSVIALLGSVVLFLAACRWWWTNRSFGLTPVHLRAAGGSRSHLRWWALGLVGICLAMMAMLILARNMS
jgi:hypothetical protein